MAIQDEQNNSESPQFLQTTSRRSRKSIVLASALGIIGLLVILGNFALLIDRIANDEGIPWLKVPWSFRIWELELRMVAALVGMILLAAAFFVVKRRARIGLLLGALASILAITNRVTNDKLRHYFAGDKYTIEGPNGAMTVVTIEKPAKASPRTGPKLIIAPFSETVAKATQDQWAKSLKRSVVEKNSAGMDMVLIPPGEIEIGRSESLAELEKKFPVIEISAKDEGFKSVINSEQPKHKIQITNPFYMDRHNVTLAQFRTFIESTGYVTEAEKDGKGGSGFSEGDPPAMGQMPTFNWRNTGFPQQDDSPVVNISWNDAMEYCRWLSKKENKKYRLPTDAEWEYACRAGTTTRYYCGDDPNALLKTSNIADIAYYSKAANRQLSPEMINHGVEMGIMVPGDDGYAFTSPVGKFSANAFGLFDMQGNASTWCMDWYASNYYAFSEFVDPQGPDVGAMRIVRGGNWQFYPAYCRSASRFTYEPSRREPFLGFRIVCELDSD